MKRILINPRCVPLRLYRRQFLANLGILAAGAIIFKELRDLNTKIDLLYHKLDESPEEKLDKSAVRSFVNSIFGTGTIKDEET